MKTPFDPRHQRRREAIQALFIWSFQKGKSENKLAQNIIKNTIKIEKPITKHASQWPTEQINRIDLAILRLAVFELLIEKKQPPKVIVDEAVELAKEFGSESSSSFVNGVLGAIIKEKDNKKKKE